MPAEAAMTGLMLSGRRLLTVVQIAEIAEALDARGLLAEVGELKALRAEVSRLRMAKANQRDAEAEAAEAVAELVVVENERARLAAIVAGVSALRDELEIVTAERDELIHRMEGLEK